jgi:transposase
MSRHPKRSDRKLEALRQAGTLNPKPQAVRDPAFSTGEFFDARDLLQVKYEMLRRACTEGHEVGETAALFGVSRPTFYKAKVEFQREGLVGLLPRKRGPRGPHKLTDEVADYVAKVRAEEQTLGAGALVDRVQEQFGLTVHRRSIERALSRRKKKPR